MALASDIIAYANSLIQGNGNINNTDGLLFLNDASKDYHLEMIKRGVEASQLQEAYRNASIPASGQGSTFLYPNDMLLLKTLSVNYLSPVSGNNMQNYTIAQQIDIGNTQQNQSFEFLRINQPIQNPLFDDRGDWFELFPTFTMQMNLNQAIRIFYYLNPTPYTSVTDTVPYPENLDYVILALKLVSIYYDSLTRVDDSAIFQTKYMSRLERLVMTLVKGADQPIQTQGLGLTGYEF